MGKRILLINPPWVLDDSGNAWKGIAGLMPPLGLAWIAAVLEEEGHTVGVFDANAEQVSVRGMASWLAQHGPCDMVGITATTPLIANAIKIAEISKRVSPETTTVLGGVHPTVLPEEVLANEAVDLVVRGEGEATMVEIAAGLARNEIRGISYREHGGIRHTPDRELIKHLDELPFPAYHLLPMEKYRPASGAAKRMPATSVLATRGCPGRCTFCYRIFGPRLRCRSGRNIADEVKLLQQRYGVREICFYDDTFTSVRKEVRAFCEILLQEGIDLTWSCFSRIDTFCETTFSLMRKAGCHQVMYGIETWDPIVLKRIRKRIDPDRVEGVVRATQNLGIDVRAAFMLGTPGETVESIAKNIQYAIDLDPDLAIFNMTTPFPGTEMFDWADKNGFLLTKDWRQYDLSKPVMSLPGLPPATLKRYYKKAFRSFYMRPAYIWKRLKRLRSREELLAALRALGMILKV